MRASSRWHTRGRPIVYCAPNPATALLEILVHAEIDIEDIPLTFRYMEILAPDSVPLETPDLKPLGHHWPDHLELTRQLGDEWLRSGRSALMAVPSVLVPATSNVVMNPRHAASDEIKVQRVINHPLDTRLVRDAHALG